MKDIYGNGNFLLASEWFDRLSFVTPTVAPMRAEGVPQPNTAGPGKPSRYKPCPNNPPRNGSKRKRQWR